MTRAHSHKGLRSPAAFGRRLWNRGVFTASRVRFSVRSHGCFGLLDGWDDTPTDNADRRLGFPGHDVFDMSWSGNVMYFYLEAPRAHLGV